MTSRQGCYAWRTRRALLGEFARFGADAAVVNADVVTMDPARPRAEAVAVKAGRIAAVGSTAEVQQAAILGTRVLDLDRATLVPGFVDTHSHVSAWSHTILQVDGTLAVNRTIADIVDKVGERAATQPPGTWIEGYGYDHLNLEEKRHLTRWDLETVAPKHPVHFLAHRGPFHGGELQGPGDRRAHRRHSRSGRGGDLP